ncbi:Hypothetical_protein [Hexamita inflata]|uniref:Hypothetical_protein n=1 Tax=Hexamita inflata TaxID=28002 RepID=A0ABP1GWR4_9EUKA
MIAIDDLQHILQLKELAFPIEIQRARYDITEKDVIYYSIILTSPSQFPISKQDTIIATIQAKQFYIFSQVCAHISICPVFPEQLVYYSGTIKEDYLKYVEFFLKLVFKFATKDSYIHQTQVFRALFCKPLQESCKELSQLLSEMQKHKLLRQILTKNMKMNYNNQKSKQNLTPFSSNNNCKFLVNKQIQQMN